jgi:hypothetical protein
MIVAMPARVLRACSCPDAITSGGLIICPAHLALLSDFKRWLYKGAFDRDRACLAV